MGSVDPFGAFPLGSADRTIELWVYLRSSFGSYPSLTEMFAQYGTFGTTGAAFALFTYGTPSLYWSQWGSSFTGGSISLGVWTHVAATSASGTITLFQDGRAVASQALFPYDTPAGTTFYIGGQGPDPEQKVDRLTGMADEVTVYNRALSPAEIAAIHAAGSAGKCR
jgi:Concanavalin A-like lectin/glucanases superfamily